MARDRSPRLSASPLPRAASRRVAAAAGPVVVVAHRILLVVVLVVFLGRPELGRRDDRRDDRLLERLRLLERRLRRLGGCRCSSLCTKIAGAVLRADVAELAVLHRRIDVVPEDVEQLLVADLLRVVDDLHRLGVAGAAGRDLLVGRVLRLAARVAGRRRDARLEACRTACSMHQKQPPANVATALPGGGAFGACAAAADIQAPAIAAAARTAKRGKRKAAMWAPEVDRVRRVTTVAPGTRYLTHAMPGRTRRHAGACPAMRRFDALPALSFRP